MKKTVIALLTVLLLIPAVVFAEGSKEVVDTKKEVKLNPVGTYPIVQEPIEVDIMVAQRMCVEDFNTNDFTKFMEELTGIKVNYIQVPFDSAAEKLNLVLAGSDWPDAFLGFSEQYSTTLESLYGTEEHLMMPLNKFYSDEYMPNMMASFRDAGISMNSMLNLDGNIYTLPITSLCYHCQNQWKMWYNHTLLEALDLEVPQTTDEFYEVLKAIKTQDPNGNGKADEIPLAGSITGWATSLESFLLNSFIYTDLDYDLTKPVTQGVGYYLDGDTVKTMVNSDEYREGLKYLNKLYSEGLLYNGSFSQDQLQLIQLIENGDKPVVGFATGGFRGVLATMGSERFCDLRPLAPLEGPDGVREARVLLQIPQPGALFISADSPYGEAICRYFDYMFSWEGYMWESYGQPGKGWGDPDEGAIGVDGTPALWKEIIPWNGNEPQNHTWVIAHIGYAPYILKSGLQSENITREDPRYWGIEFSEKELLEDTRDLYQPYSHAEKQLPLVKFTVDEDEKFATALIEYANYVRSEGVKFIVGTSDPNSDAAWNKYLAGLKKLQIDDLLALYQSAYDRQYR